MDAIEFSRRLDDATSDLGVLIQDRFKALEHDSAQIRKLYEWVKEGEHLDEIDDKMRELFPWLKKKKEE